MLTKEAAKKFAKSGLDSITNIISEPAPKGSGIMVFPRELREEKQEWPCISFSTENQFVFLPIPAGITFSDNLTYNTINLGVLGPTAINALQQFANTLRSDLNYMQDSARASLSNVLGDIKDRVMSGNAAAAASILARKMPLVSELADRIDFANKQVIAPNSNTAFEAPGIRTFAFSFKLVSQSAADTEAIRAITTFFRKYAYPEGNTVLLKYPPVWKIKFYNGEDRNMYIPGIYGCYLTSMGTVYNSSGNMFHDDGSPIEVDIALSFQETKALTRLEIDKLNSGEGEV